MTGTESVYPKGQLRFTSEVVGQVGLVVQTFIETKCEKCGNLYQSDLQHITQKAEALKHAGEAWGWCPSCLEAGRSRGVKYSVSVPLGTTVYPASPAWLRNSSTRTGTWP